MWQGVKDVAFVLLVAAAGVAVLQTDSPGAAGTVTRNAFVTRELVVLELHGGALHVGVKITRHHDAPLDPIARKYIYAVEAGGIALVDSVEGRWAPARLKEMPEQITWAR